MYQSSCDLTPLNSDQTTEGQVAGEHKTRGGRNQDATWTAMAYALMGENSHASALFALLHPGNHDEALALGVAQEIGLAMTLSVVAPEVGLAPAGIELVELVPAA